MMSGTKGVGKSFDGEFSILFLLWKKNITAMCYEFDKPCYLDTCLCVLAIRGSLTLPSASLTRLITVESWPLLRAKAACLFCSGSGATEEAGKGVVSLKNSSVSAAFMVFKLVWFYVNFFSCMWFLEVTTIFSKGRNSRWEVQTQDEKLNFKHKTRGFWWFWWFVFQFKRFLAWEYRYCHRKCFDCYPLYNP